MTGTDPAVVDLRSDTVTRPDAAMRQAMANADVGDDVLGDDPTVERLEQRVAELLGKPAALFFPSGIMANQTAVLVLSTPGTEVVIEAGGHILNYEAGAAGLWSGVQLHPVAAPDNLLDARLVDTAIRPDGPYGISTSLVCLENTHNAGGGRVLPLDAMLGIRETCTARSIPVHLDGARLWNASVASGTDVADFAACADTVMVTLSKGLGCPVGSVLAGPEDTMREAWLARRRFGGGMRQSGILAAAGLYALENNRARLADDHENAALLARLVAEAGLHVVEPETNIVMIDLPEEGPDAAATAARLGRQDIRLSQFGPRRLRAVTHMDIDRAGIRRAADALVAITAGASA